jgi:hypothetical protein
MTLSSYTLYTSSEASNDVEIQDNGDNTFKLTGTIGKNGTRNNIYGIQIF